ncbi:MAG: cryptochrome/photolyase family protein, partial [Lewinellaceae bacterium]|nr:cryptochrome/photolyase family protein [Lewinellaceae bacterium]
MTRIRKLRLLLGDQLNHQHSWFREKPAADTLYVLMETRSETDYARHHIQKVVGFFLAMRAFADHLRAEGFQVKYLTLDDPANRQQMADNLKALFEEYGVETWEYQLPDEYRLDVILADFAKSLPIPVTVADTEHFLSPRDGVEKCFTGKKTYLLETFYRKIRRQYAILMEPDGETPLTGRWNFDAENRHKMPADQPIPPPWQAKRDVDDLVAMIKHVGVETIGEINTSHFSWPVTRAEALDLLQHFVRFRLRYFGRYQDALTSRQFLLFHSMLSFVMNVKLLHPLEVVQAVINYWEPRQGDIELATVEGFIRQIIGWREYMRGVYWAKMPAYRDLNYFGHTAPLP